MLIILAGACSKKSDVDKSDTDSEASTSSETGIDSVDTDSSIVDSETESDTDTSPKPVQLYDYTAQISSIQVNDEYLYIDFTLGGIIRVKKDGSSETPEEVAPGHVFGNFYFDENYAFWISGTKISRFDKKSKEITYFDVPQDIYQDTDTDTTKVVEVGAIAGDDDNLYLETGQCNEIIQLNKMDGQLINVCKKEPRSDTYIRDLQLYVSDTHVYCSEGQGSYVNTGRMFRCEKGGDTLEYVTTWTDTDKFVIANEPHVGPMMIVGDKIYYVTVYGNVWYETLCVAPKDGGESTMIEKITDVSGATRLFYDAVRNSLFWAGDNDKDIIRYDFESKKISYISIPSLLEQPIDMDEDYFYYNLLIEPYGIYRIQK